MERTYKHCTESLRLSLKQDFEYWKALAQEYKSQSTNVNRTINLAREDTFLAESVEHDIEYL